MADLDRHLLRYLGSCIRYCGSVSILSRLCPSLACVCLSWGAYATRCVCTLERRVEGAVWWLFARGVGGARARLRGPSWQFRDHWPSFSSFHLRP